jgi:hypothetical protein
MGKDCGLDSWGTYCRGASPRLLHTRPHSACKLERRAFSEQLCSLKALDPNTGCRVVGTRRYSSYSSASVCMLSFIAVSLPRSSMMMSYETWRASKVAMSVAINCVSPLHSFHLTSPLLAGAGVAKIMRNLDAGFRGDVEERRQSVVAGDESVGTRRCRREAAFFERQLSGHELRT